MADPVTRPATGWQALALAQGLCTDADLRAAQARARESGRDVAECLVQAGTLTEEQLAQLKASDAGVVYLDVLDYQIDPAVLELVPEALARKHALLPLYRVGQSLTVVMVDPWNVTAIDEVRLSAKLPALRPVLGTASAIRKAIDRHYGHRVVEEAARQPDGDRPSAEAPAGEAPGSRRAAAAPQDAVPVAKLVQALLDEALEARASDIHLEPDETHLRVRYRIDGLLHEVKLLPVTLHEAVSSRIKLMAKLDIAEHRLPQDGHLPLTVDDRLIDLRVSTYPTVFGENVVVRLMDHGGFRLRLEDLGFAPEILAQLAGLIEQPHGVVLVTGPTGSGKTTTLYTALARINSVTKNIMTIEDPVEYRLPLIRQTQINLKAGITFSRGLRSLLRQDPDVIMVGEIRDQETAEIAVHAALTGHLVLSTLHTNDAVGAVSRLMELGVEPYLLASTLLGVVGQRLVRRICTHCRQTSPAPAQVCQRYPKLTVLSRGTGCRFCRKTGYLGRVGVCELFQLDEAHRRILDERRPLDELRRLAVSSGMRTMRDDGLRKVQEGVTTLEELDRTVPAGASS